MYVGGHLRGHIVPNEPPKLVTTEKKKEKKPHGSVNGTTLVVFGNK